MQRPFIAAFRLLKTVRLKVWIASVVLSAAIALGLWKWNASYDPGAATAPLTQKELLSMSAGFPGGHFFVRDGGDSEISIALAESGGDFLASAENSEGRIPENKIPSSGFFYVGFGTSASLIKLGKQDAVCILIEGGQHDQQKGWMPFEWMQPRVAQ